MFRLLILLVIISMIIILVISITQIFKEKLITNESSKNTTADEIEDSINKIKIKILRAEVDQLNGIEGAKKEIENLKNQLSRIQELKEKTKNL
jgi:hypothetical protein